MPTSSPDRDYPYAESVSDTPGLRDERITEASEA